MSDRPAPAANYEAVVKELQAQLAATHAAIRALPRYFWTTYGMCKAADGTETIDTYIKGEDLAVAGSLEEYDRDIGIGCNHLANALLAMKIRPSEYRQWGYDAFLAQHGQPAADIWVCWKALMNRRDALVRLLGDPAQEHP